ncbi:MAG: hypothetical protein LQ349_002335 [Xanthoria aureola]|nr:MAG: hypothetical protein LQ349_002335 [Xanthoria aureola]
MKPVVSALNAWSCVVVSVFAIVILSIIGGLFKVRRRLPPEPKHHPLISREKNANQALADMNSFFCIEQSNHHSMVGTTKDPGNGPAVAGSVFAAVIVYVVFLVFCGFQAFLHNRQSKRGAISLN